MPTPSSAALAKAFTLTGSPKDMIIEDSLLAEMFSFGLVANESEFSEDSYMRGYRWHEFMSHYVSE